MKYRLLQITTNIEEYPSHKKDTEEFPELVEYVEDDSDIFIMDEEKRFWYANEFFYQSGVTEFESEQVGGICHHIGEYDKYREDPESGCTR